MYAKVSELLKLLISIVGLWLFVCNFGLSTEQIAAWNSYSRISVIFKDLGVYGFRSELMPTIIFLMSGLMVFTVSRISQIAILGRKFRIHIYLVASFFSLIWVLGNIAEKSSYIFGGPFRWVLFSASFFKWYGLFFILSNLLSILYSYVNIIKEITINQSESPLLKENEVGYLFYWVIIIISWLPYVIFNFPGVVTTDGFYQLRQVAGIAPITDHHPVIHTMLLWLVYKIAMVLNGTNSLTLILYTVFQLGVLSSIYASTIVWLRSKGLKSNYLVIVLCFYAFFPIHGFNATVLSKDFLSGGFILLSILWMYDLVLDDDNHPKTLLWYIKGIIWMLLAGLLRNNAYYAYLVTSIVLVIFILLFNINRKIVKISSIAIVILLLLAKPMVLDMVGIPDSPATESLSIPIQQIARSLSRQEKIPEEVQSDVEKFFSIEEVKTLYDPYISDPVKFHIASKGGDLSTILRLWKYFLFKDPLTYFDSFLISNFGYWYPQINFSSILFPSDIEIYKAHDINVPFDGKGMYIAASIAQAFQFIPILNLLAGIGFVFFILAISFDLSLLFVEGKQTLIIYVPLILTFGTLLIAAPMTGSPRYAHFLFSCMPVFIFLPLIGIKRRFAM